jgi:hypothetical protein
MSGGGRVASFRLSPTQELVTQTIALGQAAALDAWRRVRPTIDLDVMEEGSYFLLPALYRRLGELGVPDADLGRLKGVYRRTWYRNQLLLDELQRPFVALSAEAIPLLAYGPLSLATSVYSELGLRWIPYAEVITEAAKAGRAGEILEREGFARAEGARRHPLQPTPYVNGGGQVLVVAGAPPLDLLAPDALGASGEEIWARALELRIGGASIKRLDPTHELMLACLAGAKPAGRDTPIWVVDALRLLPTVDWTRLVADAQESRTSLALRETLRYLVDSFAADVPADALHELDSLPVARRDVLARRLVAHTGGVAGGLPATLADYLRLSHERGPLRVIAGLPAFLRRTWGLDHLWQVPVRAVTKTVASARR